MRTGENLASVLAVRVTSLLDDVEYTLVDPEAQREAVYRLRYDCYLAEQAIIPNDHEIFDDEFDGQSNSFLFGISLQGRLISSIRIHIVSPECPYSPSMTAFSDVLRPVTDRGETFTDPSRFVIDRNVRGFTPLMPYVTLRLASMAADHFDTDHILATARIEHTPFYRRIFRLEPRTPPRAYPGLVKPLCLLSNEMDVIRDKVYSRYPIFSSDAAEREAIFGPVRSPDLLNRKALLANDNGRRYRRYSLTGHPTADERPILSAAEPD